ncbi:hypothetical protein [Robiginitalea sp. SC105]|uniref:hypothetical protein n=1 Tax=Robiginitalea sp. SC105 TaxID=2762332 RepID=UPI001639D235|nr:hypothetical protein [Robiginitalea sp. SC105]MBC2838750.1 hypothetical protein [Robiginitalea sp. SC105]
MDLKPLFASAFFCLLALPAVSFAQSGDSPEPAGAETGVVEIPEHILQLADTLAVVNQIHGPYVGFTGETSAQYRNFVKLSELACTDELLQLTTHKNAVVRAYAFWALARQQYEELDEVLLEHARDEELVREMQGGMVTRVPVIDFMQWVVDPDLLDADSKKLEADVFEKVSEIRFSDR